MKIFVIIIQVVECWIHLQQLFRDENVKYIMMQ